MAKDWPTEEVKKKKQSGEQSSNKALDALEEDFATGDEGRGRCNAGPVETQVPMFTLDPVMLATFWKILFSVPARSQGEHWNLTDSEAAQLGALSVPLVEKWMPRALEKYGAEMILASGLIFTIIPRMQVKKKKVVNVDEKDSGNIDNSR